MAWQCPIGWGKKGRPVLPGSYLVEHVCVRCGDFYDLAFRATGFEDGGRPHLYFHELAELHAHLTGLVQRPHYCRDGHVGTGQPIALRPYGRPYYFEVLVESGQHG
jgi:hypothetical protein